jgi:hypothetical protein
VSGDVCTATKTIDASFSNDIRDKIVTLSCMVLIPDATWAAGLVLIDGDRNKEIVIPNGFKTSGWVPVSVPIRVGSAATELSFRGKLVVGSGGVGYIANAALTLGGTPRRCVSSQLRGAEQHFVRQRVATVTLLGASTQVDPTVCGIRVIEGDGGAVTISTAQAFFSNSTQWRHGMTIRLIGNSNTNTVTFTSNATQNMRLGAATRVLSQNGVLEMMWWATTNRWIEVSFSPGGF